MATKTTKKPENNTKNTNAKLTWLPKKTFELEIIISWLEVTETYDHVLEHFVANTEIKGFRKGKAPKKTVESYVGKAKIYEEVVEHAVSDAYIKAIKAHNLKPIVNPQVNPVSMEENKDWVVKVKACEYPEVKLGDYEKEVRGLRAKNALWTPDKAAKPETDAARDNKPTVDEVLDEVIKVTTVDLPDMLLETETNRLLSQLVDQAQAAGITLNQYLESKGLTKEQLQKQYQDLAEKNLKVEFILNDIAEKRKIEIPLKEVDDLLAKTKDETVKKSYQDDRQKTYLAIMLRKQKVVDYLMSL